MNVEKTIISEEKSLQSNRLNQGDCVKLIGNENLFQIIGIDKKHQKCWIRKWPLMPKGSPVFEVSIQQIYITSKSS